MRSYFGLAVAVAVWGVQPVFLKQLLDVFSPLEVAFLRFFSSSLVLLALVLATQPEAMLGALRRNLRGILASSILGPMLSITAFGFALQTAGIGVASVTMALQPILTYLIAIAVGQEQASLPRLLSILLSLAGMIMIVAVDATAGEQFWIGLLAAAVAPLIIALNTVISKRVVAKESPLVLLAINMTISSAGLAPFQDGGLVARLGTLEATHWAALAFCVLGGTVVATTLWYGSLRTLASSTISVFSMGVPLLSLFGGIAFLGETLTLLKSGGVTLVLYGLYLVNVKYKGHGRANQ
jgi:drug/metabolite transporter (DMT)-like permease